MGYCAISGNSGGDSIKFPSTEEMPYRQYNRLCSDSIMLSPTMNHNENSLKTASISLKCKGENDFSNPWLCFNYVPTGFESSAHRGIASFLDSIKLYTGNPFPFFSAISGEFCRHLITSSSAWRPPPAFHSVAHSCSGGLRCRMFAFSRYGVKRRKSEENVSNTEKSPRTVSHTAAALK